jgi:VWFA-related protein
MDHPAPSTWRAGTAWRAAIAFLAATTVASGQEPQLSFPATTEVVTVDVVVTDKDGLPVAGLASDDFTITEDGEPQEIVAFEAVDRPLPAAPAPPPPLSASRASSNEDPARRQASSFVIVFDEVHLDPGEAERVRVALRKFLSTALAPGDQVALVGTGEGTRWTARMPRGREVLLRGLDRLRGRLVDRDPRERMTDWEAMQIARFDDPTVVDRVVRRFLQTGLLLQRPTSREGRQSGAQESQKQEDERQQREEWRSIVRSAAASVYARASILNEQTLAVIEREMASFAGARRRKTIILASGGLIADPDLLGPQRVVNAARRANAAVYFLDARGLVAAPLSLQAENQAPTSFPDLVSMQSEIGERSQGTEGLAADTGGFSIKNRNDLAVGLERVAQEARRYYLLGYTPTNGKPDGSFRRIRVKVGREGVTVRARRGYFAPRHGGPAAPEKPAAAILGVLLAPLDQGDVPLRAVADTLGNAGEGKKAVRVTVEADIRALSLASEGEVASDTLTVAVRMTRLDTGDVVRLDQQLQLKLSPQTRACYERRWLPIARTVELEPGSYEARIAVYDGNGGKAGSLTHDFDVPGGPGLRLTSLALSDVEGPPEGDLELTALRRFPRGASLRCRFGVQGAAVDPANGRPDITAGFSVRGKDGTVLAAAAETPVRPDPDGTLVRTVGLPLGGASPGYYELIVVATDRVAGQAVEARESFAVEEKGAASELPAFSCRVDARALSARYWAIVDLYARGTVSDALAELGRLPDSAVQEEVAGVVKAAERAARCTDCPELEALRARPVAAAAMLHGDAAWAAPAGSSTLLQELERARALAEALRPLPGGDAFARRFFLASVVRGHQQMDWRAADRLATEALERFPDDPDLLLAQGTLLETVGWRAAADRKAMKPYLERAESALARAEELSPSEEATVRLAHVRWQLGRASVARASLQRLAPAGDPWRYVAFLFLGGALEEEGRFAEAEEAYRQALETEPNAQSARVALAHCLTSLGRVGAARQVVDQALGLASVRDPFLAYPWGRSADSDALLGALRLEARACCR